MGNALIFIGITFILLGIIFNFFSKFSFPFLPGDIFIQKENFTFYFPIVSSLLLSLILTIIFNLFRQ